jgi:predicted lysophospholipase L1 biosynthesis ABC-type transport system permease subunit
MFVFRPGTFDQRHNVYLRLQGPQDADARAKMQADLVTQFPNVSVIDLREILATIQDCRRQGDARGDRGGRVGAVSGGLILVGA